MASQLSESGDSTFTVGEPAPSETSESTPSGIAEQENGEPAISSTEHGIISSENYRLVPGARRTSELLYLTREKCLYTPINTDKYGVRYHCFVKHCTARVLLATGHCKKSKRNAEHVAHGTHESLLQEFEAVNKMKSDCENIDVLCGGAGQTVSVRAVFNKNVLQ